MKKQHNYTSHVPVGLTREAKAKLNQSPSLVKLVNVQIVDHQADLLHLVANQIKQHSKTESVLAKMLATRTTITYYVNNKRVANSIAQKVKSAFKHYHPIVDIRMPHDETYYDITVTFNDSKVKR